MNIKKSKISVMMLAFVFMLTLAACSGGIGTSPDSPAQGGNSISTTTPKKEIQTALAPIASDSIQDYDYIDIGKMFTDAGFTNVTTTELFDIDPDADDYTYTNIVSIGGVSVFDNADAFPVYSSISIICHRPYEKYTLSIHVDFVANLLFSTYNVDLLVDDVQRETLEHGKDADFEFRLKAGDYPITFAKSDSSSVNGSAEIKLDSDIMVSYKIACYNDKVTVEDFTSQFLEQQQVQAVEDERKAAEAAAENERKAAEVAAAEKAAEILKTLEIQLPQEMAQRAAIVAITNYCTAIDVYMPDGNTLDVSKFHSYADTSGNFFNYYIGVKSWGEWSAKDEDTWHTEKLTYVNCFGNAVNASLDVQYDGENYIVSNVVTSFGDLSNPSNSGIDKYSTDFVVTPDLVKDARGQSRLDSYNSWVDNQFSVWDGSHSRLSSLIKNRLNDEKSYKHIETTYRIIYSEDTKLEINNILKSSNKSTRVEIGDVFISIQFSAKNAFNATVKNTAFGIASFAENSIILIAIE